MDRFLLNESSVRLPRKDRSDGLAFRLAEQVREFNWWMGLYGRVFTE